MAGRDCAAPRRRAIVSTGLCACDDARSQPARAREMTIIQVKVKPNARVNALAQLPDGSWLAQIKAAPIEGQANEALIALVARHFGRRRSQVLIRSGASGRVKRVQIDDD